MTHRIQSLTKEEERAIDDYMGIYVGGKKVKADEAQTQTEEDLQSATEFDEFQINTIEEPDPHPEEQN